MTADIETAWLSLRTQLAAHRPGPETEERSPGVTTPVSLITGFLGAGKTFLLASLLKNPPDGLRIKAVVNDVGALDFDPTLIESRNDVRVELANGCGCCERTAELAETLAALTDEVCDLIVLEASGAADPLAVAQVIEADARLRLDRIVAVVPAARLNATALTEPAHTDPVRSIVERQIDSAHCVVVTACDQVEPSVADAAVERAARLAPGRVVTRSSRGSPATDVLLPSTPTGARPSPIAVDDLHGHLHAITLDQRRAITRHDLESALRSARPALVRAKGCLVLDDQPCLVQLTPVSTTITPAPEWSDEPSAITLITVAERDAQHLVDLIGAPKGHHADSSARRREEGST